MPSVSLSGVNLNWNKPRESIPNMMVLQGWFARPLLIVSRNTIRSQEP